MIKFDKNEFLKPQIYSTLDEYESRCNVVEEIIEEIEQLQQENQSLKKENKILRENAEHNDKVVDKVNWENQKYKEVIDKAIEKEEEIMYLANKVAITTQNIEIKAIRDRLEEIFKILKEVE